MRFGATLSRLAAGVAFAASLGGRASAEPPPAPIRGPACHWLAARPYVQIADGAPVPHLARAVFDADSAPDDTPGVQIWNPDLTRRGRVHAGPNGDMSSIVSVSGGECAGVRVAVLVYRDGYVPQRSFAFDSGDSQARDELDSGAGEVATVAMHGEFADPGGARRTIVSADARSIGYVHRAGDVTNVGDTSQSLRPTFGVRDTSLEVRAGIDLIRGGPAVELSYLGTASNAGRPNVSGAGIAFEIPPTLEQTLSAYGALSYYPNLSGGGVRYRAVRFRAGATLSLLPFFGHPYYFDVAAIGDRRSDASRAPSSVRFQGIVFGLGYRFGSRL